MNNQGVFWFEFTANEGTGATAGSPMVIKSDGLFTRAVGVARQSAFLHILQFRILLMQGNRCGFGKSACGYCHCYGAVLITMYTLKID
jgi:hypothetical protein